MVARERGAFVVEINPTSTAVTPFVDSHLQGQAGTYLPKILAILTMG
jgi:NAD-dependent SIR2 family protein deacetylase